MSRAVMQEFLRGKPSGEPLEFLGDDFYEVTEHVFLDLMTTYDPAKVIKIMLKWLEGKPYAEKLGSFSMREYEPHSFGVWCEWTYTD